MVFRIFGRLLQILQLLYQNWYFFIKLLVEVFVQKQMERKKEDLLMKRKMRKTIRCLFLSLFVIDFGKSAIVFLVTVCCNFLMFGQYFLRRMVLVVNVLRFFEEDGKLMKEMVFQNELKEMQGVCYLMYYLDQRSQDYVENLNLMIFENVKMKDEKKIQMILNCLL